MRTCARTLAPLPSFFISTEHPSKIAKNADIFATCTVQSLKDTEWKLVQSADDHSTRVLARSHHARSDSSQKSAPSGVGMES
jgi:hypothetical protein